MVIGGAAAGLEGVRAGLEQEVRGLRGEVEAYDGGVERLWGEVEGFREVAGRWRENLEGVEGWGLRCLGGDWEGWRELRRRVCRGEEEGLWG